MQKVYLILFALVSAASFSQSKIIVKNAENQKPISGASVKCDNKILGKTNILGELEFKSKCKKVDISAPGFYNDDAVVDKMMEVILC